MTAEQGILDTLALVLCRGDSRMDALCFLQHSRALERNDSTRVSVQSDFTDEMCNVDITGYPNQRECYLLQFR